MKVGYARVSSTGQNLESQIELLQKIGCEKIFTEKKSGKQTDNRIELKNALEYVREGDEFYVTRLDRCSRSVKDLHTIIDYLNKKRVSFKATEQDLDTSTSTGRLMIGLLSIVSEFETDLRAERQADGIKSAKKRGVQFGRKKKLTESQVKKIIELQQIGEMTNQDIADKYEVGRSTMLREIANYKDTIESTKGFILVDYNLNIIDQSNKIYEKLISKRIDKIQENMIDVIDSYSSATYKNIDFTREVYELKITESKIFLRRYDGDIQNDKVLKSVVDFSKSTKENLTNTSMLNFKDTTHNSYNEFGFEELDD